MALTPTKKPAKKSAAAKAASPVLLHQITADGGDSSSAQMASAPLVAGDRVFWAWTSGVVGLSGQEPKEVFRQSYGYREGQSSPFGVGGITLFAAEGRVIVTGASLVQGATEIRWHDAESGAEVASVRCAEVTNLCAVAGRLYVFTSEVPEPESVTVAPSRVEELGPEYALELHRAALRSKREIYTNPEYRCVFGNGAVLTFDLGSGRPLEAVSFGDRGEKFLQVQAMGDRVVLAPVVVAEPWRSDSVRVHRAAGAAALWKQSGALLAVGSDAILLRDGDAVRCLGADGSERWSVVRPIDEGAAIGSGLACFLGAYDGKKTRPLVALDLGTGGPRWSSEVGKYAGLPVFDAGHAWVLDPQGKLAAFAVETGEAVARVPGKDLRAVASLGGICAASSKGRMYELAVYSLAGEGAAAKMPAADATPDVKTKTKAIIARPGGSDLVPGQLFGRLKAWFDLFAKRGDIEVTEPLALGRPGKSKAPYPADAADLARSASTLTFCYRLVRREPDQFDGGFVNLSLDGEADNVDLVIPGYGSVDEAVPLDLDRQGTGLAAWFVLDEAAPFIAWSVEDPVRFASLTEYLTLGARRAFSYPRTWQRGGESPLVAASLSKSTPLPEIRAALVSRGAGPETADDLIAWLGADAALLVPAASKAKPRKTK